MRGRGKLTRKQIKGILTTHGRINSGPGQKVKFVCDGDINAIMRRMDSDGDEEVSFSDYFTSMLPYFIYGELKTRPSMNQLVSKALHSKVKSNQSTVKKINVQNRAVSASAA